MGRIADALSTLAPETPVHPSFGTGRAPRGPLDLFGTVGRAVESTGSRIGQALASLVEPKVPSPVVNPPGVYPRVQVGRLPSMLSHLPAAIAETLPTEAAKFVTPQALLTQAAFGGALRGLAGTRLGQFPVETLLPPGRIREALSRLGAPHIFAPITKPKGPIGRGPIVEAEFTETPGVPKALPSPETVGRVPQPRISTEPPRPGTITSAAPVALGEGRIATPTQPQAQRGGIQGGIPSGVSLVPVVQARNRAITLLTRELREQSVLIHQRSRDLFKTIRELGGIDPSKGGGIREELVTNIPKLLLQRGGRAIDDIIGELNEAGFPVEDSNALLKLVASSKHLRPPLLAFLRQEAARIVDTEPGQRLMEVVSQPRFATQAANRLVKDVAKQVNQEVLRGQRQVRGILTEAQRKAMTPAQLARFARVQRIEPGATTLGPRGGLKEAPLTPVDIRRVKATTANLVLPRGQPTGTPPNIPTSKALTVPVVPGAFRDLTEFQAAKLSGLEPYRAFRLIDNQQRGLATTRIYEPTLAVTRQKADAEQVVLERLTRLVPGLRAKTPEDTALMALGENKLPAEQVTPRLLRAAGEMRETYDRLLAQLNEVRVKNGKVPILRRTDYMPHLRMQTLMAEVFGGFDQIPDDAVNLTLQDIHPNSPYAWFQNRREGGPYAKSAVEAYQAWVGKALEGIHYPEVIRTIKPLLRDLPPRAREYAQAYVDQVLAGRAHPTDLIPPPTLLRWIDRQRATTSQGAVSGNLLSFFNQILTMPATVSSAGPINTARSVLALSGNALQRFVSDLGGKVGIQTAAEAVLKAQQPDVLNFIESHSPLIKYRTYDVDFNVKPTVGGQFNPLAAIATAQNAFDVAMVRVAWYANYLKAARAGLSNVEAVRIAEDAATATNGNFEKAALAPLYRSRLAKSATQFTVSINNVLNYLRFDAGVQPSRLLGQLGARMHLTPSHTPPWQTVKQAAFFIGTAVALNELIKASRLPIKQTGTHDILPGVGIFTGQVPATYALPMALGQRLLAKQPQDIAKADAALWRAAWLQAPYGNQIRKSVEGIMAVAAGGSFTKKGMQRFPVTEPAEQARAVAFGPYGTVAGQAYIQRGFKPQPLSPEQKMLQRRLSARLRRRR